MLINGKHLCPYCNTFGKDKFYIHQHILNVHGVHDNANRCTFCSCPLVENGSSLGRHLGARDGCRGNRYWYEYISLLLIVNKMNSGIYTSPKELSSKYPTLVQTFQTLLDSGEDSDVNFKIKDQDIRAHKLIICARAPRLGAILKSLSPNEDPAPMNDHTPDVFKCFLNFLYTDDCYISTANVEQLIDLAVMWDVQALVKKCMIFMENQLDERNILRYAAFGFSYGNENDLYRKCLIMLPDLLPDINFIVKDGSKWIPISYNLLFDLIKHCKSDNKLEETLLYKLIYWAQKECELREITVTPKNIRFVLDEIAEIINYNMLSPRILATVVYEYQLLASEELLNCFCKLAVEEEENVRAKIAAADV